MAGEIGEYHFDCPLDNMLFGFKGVKGKSSKLKSSKEQATRRSSNGSIKVASRKHHGNQTWAEEVEVSSLYNHPEKRDFFSKEAKKLGLDPTETTTFEWLEIDDRVSHAQAAA